MRIAAAAVCVAAAAIPAAASSISRAEVDRTGYDRLRVVKRLQIHAAVLDLELGKTALWALASRNNRTELIRIDPKTRRVKFRRRVDRTAHALAAALNGVWVAYVSDPSLSQAGRLVRYSEAGRPQAFRAFANPGRLAASGQSLWVLRTAPRHILRLTMQKGRIISRARLAGSAPRDVAANVRGALTVSDGDPSRGGSVLTFTPQDTSDRSIVKQTRERMYALATVNSRQFLGAGRSGLEMITLSERFSLKRISSINDAVDVSVAARRWWVATAKGSVVALRSPLGLAIGAVRIGKTADRLVADASGAWVADSVSGTLSRIEIR